MPRTAKTIELGPYTYTVVPQKLGRLRHSLNAAFNSNAGDVEAEELAEAAQEGRTEDTVQALGAQAHAVVGVFVPDLMPKHEWLGYVSEDAAKADEYDEARDNSPDIDQIVTAVEVCMHVNRIDLLKHLRELVSPDFLRAAIQKAIADFLMNNSPNSSSPTTADTPTTTSTTEPQTSDLDGSEEETEDGYVAMPTLPTPIGASAG